METYLRNHQQTIALMLVVATFFVAIATIVNSEILQKEIEKAPNVQLAFPQDNPFFQQNQAIAHCNNCAPISGNLTVINNGLRPIIFDQIGNVTENCEFGPKIKVGTIYSHGQVLNIDSILYLSYNIDRQLISEGSCYFVFTLTSQNGMIKYSALKTSILNISRSR